MKINYQEPTTTSKTVEFEGETQDGKFFVIIANWNEWDDWTVDEVSWQGESGTEEQEEEIRELFMSDMN